MFSFILPIVQFTHLVRLVLVSRTANDSVETSDFVGLARKWDGGVSK